MKAAFAWAQRRAEDVSVVLLLAMFLVFLLQIAARYVFNMPMGWTHEVSVMLWIWLVLFGASFVIKDSEEMRFDLLYAAVSARGRRILVAITSVAAVILLAISFPGAWDYVTFMKVEKTAYLRIRFDYLYIIYILFVVAMILRQLWFGWNAIFGAAPEEFDPTKASSRV